MSKVTVKRIIFPQIPGNISPELKAYLEQLNRALDSFSQEVALKVMDIKDD